MHLSGWASYWVHSCQCGPGHICIQIFQANRLWQIWFYPSTARVAVNISSLHFAFIYTLAQTSSYQQLLNWITAIIHINPHLKASSKASVFSLSVTPSSSFVFHTPPGRHRFLCARDRAAGGRHSATRWTLHLLPPPSILCKVQGIPAQQGKRNKHPNSQYGFSSKDFYSKHKKRMNFRLGLLS